VRRVDSRQVSEQGHIDAAGKLGKDVVGIVINLGEALAAKVERGRPGPEAPKLLFILAPVA